MRAAGGPFEIEYRLRAADGRHRWVLDRGAPAEGGVDDAAGGGVGGYVGGCLDIDTRVRERERQRLLAVVGTALDRETTVAGRRTTLVRTLVDEGLVDAARFVPVGDGETGNGQVGAGRVVAARTLEQEAVLRALDVDWMHAREAVGAGPSAPVRCGGSPWTRRSSSRAAPTSTSARCAATSGSARSCSCR